MVNIIIPAAGRGTRFSNVGYDVPKPMIKVYNNVTMLEFVIQNLCNQIADTKNIVVILQQDWVEPHSIRDLFARLMGVYSSLHLHLVAIDYVTEGPMASCLLAAPYIHNKAPVICADCDQYVPSNIAQWLEFTERNDADGSLVTFAHNDKRWSYVEALPNHTVLRVVEKNPVSNFANAGLYYFRDWTTLSLAAADMMHADDRVNKEFYVGPAYNYIIAAGRKVVHYFINEFYGLGTPEDLKRYQIDRQTRIL